MGSAKTLFLATVLAASLAIHASRTAAAECESSGCKGCTGPCYSRFHYWTPILYRLHWQHRHPPAGLAQFPPGPADGTAISFDFIHCHHPGYDPPYAPTPAGETTDR